MSIDLDKLNDYHTKDFFLQLHLAPLSLPVHLTNEYFFKLLKLLSQDIPDTVGNEILNTINKTVRSQSHLKEFVSNKLYRSLPFTKDIYLPNILDVLFEFSIQSPDAFDDYLVSQLSKLISGFPEKSLTIIANYLMKSQNPTQNMIDLLFIHTNTFLEVNIFQDYVSLLVYLCSNNNNSTFLKDNGLTCWKLIAQQLTSTEKSIVILSYNSLCHLFDLNSELMRESDIPFKYISRHLLSQESEHSVISFLLRYFSINAQLDSFFSQEDKETVIQSLLKISTQKVALLLFSFAENFECAKYLLLSNTSWMKSGIPTIHDSVILLSTIMKHKTLRPLISNQMQIVGLFDEMLKEKGTTNIEFLSIFIRRLNLSNEFISELNQIDFLTRYLTIVDEKREKAKIWIPCFLLVDTIARFSYVAQLNGYAKKICDILLSGSNDEMVNKTAIIVATDLAVYYDCALVFQSNKLHHYLKKVKSENGSNSKAAKSCLKVMKKTFSTHTDDA